MTIFRTDASALAAHLFELERCGKYDEALADIKHIWPDTDKLPDTKNLPSRTAAEIILRCGALIGFIGHNRQLPGAQEKSKNLLGEARRRYLEIYDVEKIAEAENYLALAYWRNGELTEAITWIEESLARKLPVTSRTRLHSEIIKSLMNIPTKKYQKTIDSLEGLEQDFLNLGDDSLTGDFYGHLGLAFKGLLQPATALKKMEQARVFHMKAGHWIYLGIDLNNLAQLYKRVGKYAEAHRIVDEAAEVFRKINDRTREGFALDTKAQIFLREGKYDAGLVTIDQAIAILSKSDNADYVAETYLTKSMLLLYAEDLTSAFLCLSDAVQIAKSKISEERARGIVAEFDYARRNLDKFRVKSPAPETYVEGADVDLVLDPALAHYEDYQGVWIKNEHLESFGLPKGALAVVAKQPIKRGDLIAINDLATDSIVCGFYDADFGLVCLEGLGDEPVFFDETDVIILGKVIGVGEPNKKKTGKIHIKPINF